MQPIIVLGSLNMDLVTRVHHTPAVGETILGKGLLQIPGGKGGNQAVAAARLGGDVTMIGAVGDDANGHTLRQALQADQIDVHHVHLLENVPTGTAFIMVNDSGDNSIVVVPGANHQWSSTMIPPDLLRGAGMVIAQLEIPLDIINDAFTQAKSAGVFTLLNPAPAQSLPATLLANTDLLVPNETEFQLLTGHAADHDAGLRAGADKLLHAGVGAVLVTLGADGAYYQDGNDAFYTPGYQVDAVDTTAAGDCFIGAFAAHRSRGMDVMSCIDFAAQAAALAVSRSGAQPSIPTLNETHAASLVQRAERG